MLSIIPQCNDQLRGLVQGIISLKTNDTCKELFCSEQHFPQGHKITASRAAAERNVFLMMTTGRRLQINIPAACCVHLGLIILMKCYAQTQYDIKRIVGEINDKPVI